MSSEVGTKSGMLSSIRKLLGGDNTEVLEPESNTENDAEKNEDTLVLTGQPLETGGDSASATVSDDTESSTEDGDDLVLDPTMQAQLPDDTTTVALKDADTNGDDTISDTLAISPDDAVAPEAETAAMDEDVSEDAGSALLDGGLEDVGPSSIEFNDDIEVVRVAGEGDGGDQQDFDPAVWRPVFSVAQEGGEAGGADEPATVLEDDPLKDATEDLATHVDDDNLEEMPVSDPSEDDEVTESASEAEGEAQDENSVEELTAEPDEAAADGPEDFQELLEDTVRRIVREELSGEMGQRLSQNIRKIIRDQVAEAIPARD